MKNLEKEIENINNNNNNQTNETNSNQKKSKIYDTKQTLFDDFQKINSKYI